MPISEFLKIAKTIQSISPVARPESSRNAAPLAPRGASLKCRLVIITEIIAPYRIPVFNALAEHEAIALHVIFLSENDPGIRQWRVYKDEIRFSQEVLRSSRLSFARSSLLVNRGIARALKKASPEVIVCGGYNYLAAWQALLWARRQHVPLLLWSESSSGDARSYNPAVEFLKRRFLSMSSGFVVPGISPMAYLRELGVQDQPIFTAPNAVDNDFFSKGAQAARDDADGVRGRYGLPPKFFLCVGRLIPAKGVFELLDAYAKMDPAIRAEVGLVFVGDGIASAELVERARKIQPGSLQCFGFTHREQLPEFYGLAEAFVFPTHSDPWGLVVNEAMACGLPVIASSVAGCVPDLVKNDWNGFVVPPREVYSLTRAMELIASQPELRKQMAIRSSKRIRAYSPEAWAKGMAEVAGLVAGEVS